MLSVASRTSLSVAEPAVTHAKRLPVVPVSISRPPVPDAEARPRFLLSPSPIGLSTVANVLPRCAGSRHSNLSKRDRETHKRLPVSFPDNIVHKVSRKKNTLLHIYKNEKQVTLRLHFEGSLLIMI